MGYIEVDIERCKGCDLCVSFCHAQAIELCGEINARGFHPADLVRPEKCTACSHCALICPEACITVYNERVKVPADASPAEESP